MIAGTQNWSLRLRISVNTSVSVASGIPNVARMAGSAGRRKGLVSSSSESGEGTVGCPLARALSMSLALDIRAGLSGSTVRANFALVAVY